MELDDAQTGPGQYVLFRPGGEMYGMNIGMVREIVLSGGVKDVSHAPEGVVGVTKLRGEVIPVVDLGARPGFSPGGRDMHALVLVIDLGTLPAGLLADSAQEILEIPADLVDSETAVLERKDKPFLSGIARQDDRLGIPIVDNRMLKMDGLALVGGSAA